MSEAFDNQLSDHLSEMDRKQAEPDYFICSDCGDYYKEVSGVKIKLTDKNDQNEMEAIDPEIISFTCQKCVSLNGEDY